MNSIGNTGLIGANAANLNRVLSVRRATVGERRAKERDDMISTREDEIAN